MARLREHYQKEIVPSLMKRFGYTNRMQVPRLEKIILNVGLGEATQDAKLLDAVVKEIATITGQRPVVTRAKKSIAGFKLREGMPVGCVVTLRRDRMYEFLDRLVNAALPQIRDFRGLSPKAFDGRGNYSLGIREQFIFPEIEYDKVEKVHGMDVVIVTTARTNDEGKALLSEMGMPFRN
ncbi:MAG: 50S ribosomal protein L5 [Nitrospirae bacterium RBG_16_64_22]|nr:MAG: 50S ribosomal protein L5 [Nitrospirae bacterium RBG_16_64_22]